MPIPESTEKTYKFIRRVLSPMYEIYPTSGNEDYSVVYCFENNYRLYLHYSSKCNLEHEESEQENCDYCNVIDLCLFRKDTQYCEDNCGFKCHTIEESFYLFIEEVLKNDNRVPKELIEEIKLIKLPSLEFLKNLENLELA